MTLRLNGDSSGFTEIKAADAAGDNSIKLPAANGGANQLLQNGGTAGELQYTSAGAGLHYDSSGRLLVGASSTSSNISALFQANSANSGGAGVVNISRGSSFTANNTNVGNLQFTNVDGGVLARIQVSSAGTSGGVNGNPGKLSFLTEDQGSDDGPTERLRIRQNGLISLLNSPGIDFSGIQTNRVGMTSETLDSYEEGTWTATSHAAGTVNSTNCNYTKIGRMVFLRGKVDTFSNITSDAAIEIRGLPFAPSETNTDSTVGSVMYRYIDDTDGVGPDLVTYMTSQSVRFYFQSSDGDSNYAIAKHKDLTSNSSFRFSIQYNVN